MPFLFNSDDINDVNAEISEETTMADVNGDIDDVLDSYSLEELHELRDEVISGNLPELDVSSLEPLDEEPTPDYSFHWDGGPTHNTDLDEDVPPDPNTKKLTR